jgi:hypothetical protein
MRRVATVFTSSPRLYSPSVIGSLFWSCYRFLTAAHTDHESAQRENSDAGEEARGIRAIVTAAVAAHDKQDGNDETEE